MQNTEVTREDLKKIQKSMKDPKFNNILYEYMLEVSDPKNRKENDLYLQQLEKNGELPKDLKLIKPRKFFCLESKIASETDYNYCQTIYINICLNEEIEKSEMKYSNENKGQNWKVPYSVGKQRYDQIIKEEKISKKENSDKKDKFEKTKIIDKKNIEEKENKKINSNNKEKIEKEKNLDKTVTEEENNKNDNKTIVSVIDIVFNPNIKNLCERSVAFKKMICDISIDGVQKVFDEKKEKIDKDYRIVNEFDCKGDEPSILPVKKNVEAPSTVREKTKLYHEIMDLKEKSKEKKNEIKNIDNVNLENEKNNLNEKKIEKIINLIPEYKLVYSYDTESSDFYDEQFKKRKQASKLILNIKLPKVKKLKDLKCDVKDKVLILEYLDIYFLNLNLPYNIIEDSYKAKFDRKKAILFLNFGLNKKKIDLSKENSKKIKNIENTNVENNFNLNKSEKQKIQNDKLAKIDNNQNLEKFKKFEDQKKLKVEEKILNQNEENKKTEKNINLKNENKNKKEEKEKIISKNEKNKENNSLNILKEKDETEKFENNYLLKLFNFQSIENNHYFLFNISFENKEEINIFTNEKEILLEKNNTKEYYLFKINQNYKKLEVKFVKDFITIILTTNQEKNFCYEELKNLNYEKYIVENNFKLFQNEKKLENIEINQNVENKKKENFSKEIISKNQLSCEDEKVDRITNDENELYDEDDYIEKKEIDYNFVQLNINQDLWELF